MIPESALDDIFLPDFGLRHMLNGSAITLFHVFRIAWLLLRGFCDVRVTLRPNGVACRSGQDFYYRAFVNGVAPFIHVSYD